MKKINKQLVEAINGKKAIIWDFDGVLCFANWNYGGVIEKWWDKLWRLLEEFDPDIRNKFKGGLKYYFEHTDYVSKRYGQNALKKINNFYLAKELQILPFSQINTELVSLIKHLDKDIEHYIWSNNQRGFILKALKQTGISEKFKAIASRDAVALAKPNLDGFEIIKPMTSVRIDDFLFVGDSPNTDKVIAEKLKMDFFFYTHELPFIQKDLTKKV